MCLNLVCGICRVACIPAALMNKVSMDDVASITVLKDAAATAIYGVRGANGVILVNTKRGVQGKMNINVSVEQGFQMATKIPEFVSSAEYARFYNKALKSDELAVRFTPEDIAGYEQGGSLLYPDVKWEKELLNKFSPVTDVNVAAQGGSCLLYTSPAAMFGLVIR